MTSLTPKRAGAPYFISEISSNHARDLDRSIDFVRQSALMGCDAVKFQLFKIDQLFAPEILSRSETHRKRRAWELPRDFLGPLREESDALGIAFSCTPFYLEAVAEMEPFVHFYKVASYELPWHDLIRACAQTGKPLVLSTGMATLEEVTQAAQVFRSAGGTDLTLLHCISGYPAPAEHCNLAAIKTIRDATGEAVGWSDHSRCPDVVERATAHWGASMVEFHLDLEGDGAEYETGHCWLPDEIAPVIAASTIGTGLERGTPIADGDGVKAPTPAEIDDRPWRADPSDGLRPTLAIRDAWRAKPITDDAPMSSAEEGA